MTDWLAPVDEYCERLGPGLWAEPWNLVTNLAFVLAGGVMWARCRGMPAGRMLAVMLATIGVGSGLYHSFANPLTMMMDVVPIQVFILAYLFLAFRDFLALPWWGAGLLTAGFLPYAALTVPLWARLDWLGSSAGYMPVPVVMLVFVGLLWRRAPATARGMAGAVAILGLSLTFRTLDFHLCEALPGGTHYLWHLTNAVLLGWLIEVWRRQRASELGR